MNNASVKMQAFPGSLQAAIIVVLGLLAFCAVPARGAWQLAWSDEFNQADGSPPDSSKWGFDIGNGSGGWGNHQLEYDTSRTNNARIQSSNLVIEARSESYSNFNYTSARMKTQGKWSWAYGRIEARIKIPRGQGIWPAFWMLGTNIVPVGWPTCGEIDIMENIGKTSDQGTVHGTIHGPGYSGGNGIGSTYTLPGGVALADDFHVYAVEWTTNQIKWFLDTTQYFTATPASLPVGTTWVFTAPQFIILNVAVGGDWPGSPDGTTVFPQQMQVDYVRVYSYVPSAPSMPTGLTAGADNSKTYLNWDSSGSGASGYNVKRATTSGGPYITIATTATNSYTDSAVSPCSTYYYVVSATNVLGESSNSSESVAAFGAYAAAVNSGGSAVAQYSGDAGYSGGTQAGTTTAMIDTTGVTNPAPQAVYQTERFGNFTYTFTGLTPGLTYKLRLHFAETYWTGVGQRVFNVFLNGTQVLTNFDIVAVAGAANRATIREFNVAANGSGQVIAQYATVTDNAKASGIEILLPPPAAPVAANNGPIWSGMTLNLSASTVAGAAYSWTGPNGFSSTVQNPAIANATPGASGTYSVTVNLGGCDSPAGATEVTVYPPPAVSLQPSGGNFTLSWPAGTLQTATNVKGTWSDLIGATNPYPVTPTNPQQFYRVRVP